MAGFGIVIMNTQYISEPMTTGKVLLHTTAGIIEVELWCTECPKTCRNFIQLCLEGYYDGTIFHRLVKNFILQGGDPSGTGQGGESIYGTRFEDEFHPRLRFTRCGLLGMANSGMNANGSQFFFTIGNELSRDLDDKQTLFGKITGPTIFNLLKMTTCDVDVNGRPLSIHKITGTEILTNPFDDIVPRRREKNLEQLSFGDETEIEESGLIATNETLPVEKCAHDVLNENDEKLRKPVAHSRDKMSAYEPVNDENSNVSLAAVPTIQPAQFWAATTCQQPLNSIASQLLNVKDSLRFQFQNVGNSNACLTAISPAQTPQFWAATAIPQPSSALASQLLTVNNTSWLQVDVCREFRRGECLRSDQECKFAHPPPHVLEQYGRVTACYDFFKTNHCAREGTNCKYLHPPQHIKNELLLNGRTNLAARNLWSRQLIAPPLINNPIPQLMVQQPTLPTGLMPLLPYPVYPGLVYSRLIGGLYRPAVLSGLGQLTHLSHLYGQSLTHPQVSLGASLLPSPATLPLLQSRKRPMDEVSNGFTVKGDMSSEKRAKLY